MDVLDLSIPAGPTESQPNNPDAIYTPTPYLYKEGPRATNRNTVPGTPSGVNKWDKSRYQWNIIGGFSDAFHFYPIITKGRKATIYLHNNMLDYGKEYYVTIDKGVIDGFAGIKGKDNWRFTVKNEEQRAQPSFTPQSSYVAERTIVVAADGTGDFCTLQGALDHVPDFAKSEQERWTILVKNGEYEEIV